jgi:hypothetical protein
MRLWLRAIWGEPGSMCRRIGAQCPLPADPVDAYRVHRQDTVNSDVQTKEMLEVLVVQWCVPFVSVKAKAVGSPKIAR